MSYLAAVSKAMGMYSGPIWVVSEWMALEAGETHGGVEDIYSVSSIVVERLVYDVPAVALPLIMCNLVCDVVLHGSNESCICPGPRGDYQWLINIHPIIQSRAYPNSVIHCTIQDYGTSVFGHSSQQNW